MNKEIDILIRHMRDDEKKEVLKMAKASFPFIIRMGLSLTPYVLVAERNGKLIGATVLKFFTLSQNRKCGFVSWIFTAPEARGNGAGQSLINAAIDFFKENECDEISALVEGYNTSSSKLFSTRGFSILSLEQQIRCYGFNTIHIWLKTSYFLPIGYFLWRYPKIEKKNNPVIQWWLMILINSLIILIMFWRRSGFQKIDLIAFLCLPLGCFVYFGIRELSMRITAKIIKLSTVYRPWEGWFIFNFALAFILGGWLPLPGAIYPDKDKWSYRDYNSKLGIVAFAGAFSLLSLLWLNWIVLQFNFLPHEVKVWLDITLIIMKTFVLFDVIFIFAPFNTFNGRRIWNWNRIMWSILAIASAAILLI